MSRRLFIIVITLLVVVAGSAGAQPGDYIRIGVDSLVAGAHDVEIKFYWQRECTDPETVLNFGVGFDITAEGNAFWSFSGFEANPELAEWFNLGGLMFDNQIDGTPPDYFAVSGAATPPGGIGTFEEQWIFSLYLDVGWGEGGICFDTSGFSGDWGCGGPMFIAKDSSDADHPVCITTFGVRCGDANGNGAVDIDDAVYLLYFIFQGGPYPVLATCVGDDDNSGEVDIDDIVFNIAYIFTGGPYPVCCGKPY
ncbi:MAG: hypothetical protein KKG33_12160 [candidate division Zixibacteria bacterium]|nr:hypothetical protein [candidate division Zixibacteria bacterium]MBU1471657.1 hypothetical protein [candidate division Zixibacteria bacterium]MBU2626303.1 hypothetical protein [candidate division Zixibacteria bacterium]